MNINWISDFEKCSNHALTVEWFVSPLEFVWGNGKDLAEKAFRGPSKQHPTFDELLAPELYKIAMNFDFRAKMLVYAYMREPIAKTYALEIESGLICLYGLDFMACLSQWIYVVEGYCRQFFKVKNQKHVKSTLWTIPSTGDLLRDKTIKVVCGALGKYLDQIVYKGSNDVKSTRLNRHLMVHGNLQNNAFYSQKNCLSLMFVLDALVFIEMVANGHFPQDFQDQPGEAECIKRIKRRKLVYAYHMEHSMQDPNLLKLALLDEHV